MFTTTSTSVFSDREKTIEQVTRFFVYAHTHKLLIGDVEIRLWIVPLGYLLAIASIFIDYRFTLLGFSLLP